MIFGNGTDLAEYNKLTGLGSQSTQQGSQSSQSMANPLVQNATPGAQAAPSALAAQDASGLHPNTMAFYQALMQGQGNQPYQGFNPWAASFPWLNSYQGQNPVSGMWSS